MLDLALSRGWRIGGPAAAFLGITLTLVAAVRADDWDDCNSAVPDKIISGCAGIITFSFTSSSPAQSPMIPSEAIMKPRKLLPASPRKIRAGWRKRRL